MWVGDRVVGGRRGVGEGAAVGMIKVGCDDAAGLCRFTRSLDDLDRLDTLDSLCLTPPH
jgi:hypothetical protein